MRQVATPPEAFDAASPRIGSPWLRRWLLIYGIASAVLYSSLLPLWEGFDELYHYGYAQSLGRRLTFPAVNEGRLSRELWMSLDFTPVSPFIQSFLGRTSTNFPEYFRLPEAEREARRMALERIDAALQTQPSPLDNYEVKQAPLTYLLLAPLDRLLRAAALPLRILLLRLMLALASISLTWVGSRMLARRLGLAESMECAFLFVLFSCQMTYATVSHIANDALLVPWLLFFLVSAIDAWESPTRARTAYSAALMAVGLLLKSTVLVLTPLAFAWRWWKAPMQLGASLGILVVLAGPWYLRNVLLYRGLAGQPGAAGVGARDLLRAAGELPWGASIAATAHGALWTGNSSFTAFSALTLNGAVGLLLLCFTLYSLRAKRTPSEGFVQASVLLYFAELVLVALMFFAGTKGLVNAPMPWYLGLLTTPAIALCFLGLQRWARWGRLLAGANIVLWAYIAVVSWLAKLLPMYGGLPDAHGHPHQLFRWYLEESAQRNSVLAALCPGPLWCSTGRWR